MYGNLCMYIYMCVCLSINICTNIYIYIYIYLYVCMRVCACMCTHTSGWCVCVKACMSPKLHIVMRDDVHKSEMLLHAFCCFSISCWRLLPLCLIGARPWSDRDLGMCYQWMCWWFIPTGRPPVWSWLWKEHNPSRWRFWSQFRVETEHAKRHTAWPSWWHRC